jgi:transglutaminase-like putative cysteine protease
MLGASPAATSGLSDGVRLGRATDIESSDEVVLRVRGDGPELLRGFVLTHYRAGRWSRAIAPRERTVSGLAAPAPPGPRIMLTPVGGGERYLLPLEASAVWLASDRAVVDQYGQWKAPRGQVAGPASFAVGRQQLIDPPGPSETAVPPDLAGPLAELARDWAPPGPAAERLARLVARLQTGFSYSLHSRRKTNGDPVLDFLLHERSGHCEFFASALALLARSIGVPARVVTGYRVHEQNRFGGYRVVRERDAHAWVEAFIDGRWTTYDATPPSFLEGGGRASIFSALTDWVRARWSESDPARALRRAAAVAVPGLGVWLLVRVARRRRTARPGPRPTDAPWPLADELLHALAQRGWPRQPAETLEAFSRRLRAVPAVATCADGLDAYARHRYGGVAPRLEVEARLGQALRTLRDAG